RKCRAFTDAPRTASTPAAAPRSSRGTTTPPGHAGSAGMPARARSTSWRSSWLGSLCTPHATHQATAPVAPSDEPAARSLTGGRNTPRAPGAEGRAELRGSRQRLGDTRQPFHRSDDHREVFVTVRGELPGVLGGRHLHRRGRRGHGDRQLHSGLHYLLEYLGYQTVRERRRVPV